MCYWLLVSLNLVGFGSSVRLRFGMVVVLVLSMCFVSSVLCVV